MNSGLLKLINQTEVESGRKPLNVILTEKKVREIDHSKDTGVSG